MSEVRISVYYDPAAGSGPQSIDVIWEGERPDPATVAAVVAQLTAPTASVSRAQSLPSMVAAQLCRRTLCGHPSSMHAANDTQGLRLGQGRGWCVECHSEAKCPSFVGIGGS